MEFLLNFGKGTVLTAKFSFKSMRAIETRGMAYLKDCGVKMNGPLPTAWYLNNLNMGGIASIVLEEILKAGGTTIGGKDGYDVDVLFEQFVTEVNDSIALFDDVIANFNKTGTPRKAARDAAKKDRRDAEMDRRDAEMEAEILLNAVPAVPKAPKAPKVEKTEMS